MAFLTVEKGNDSDLDKKFPLGEKPVLIGRSAAGNNPDVALHDEYISRQHAEISFRENCYQIRDLKSTNGTTLDEIRLIADQFYPLKTDSVIGLGITSSGDRVILRFKETESTVRVSEAFIPALSPVHGHLSWLKIDEKKGEIWVDQKQLVLPKKEYNLIVFLYNRGDQICHRDDLIAEVWPEAVDPGGVSDAAIDQLIHRVRRKIEPDPSQPKRLINHKGFGYRLV